MKTGEKQRNDWLLVLLFLLIGILFMLAAAQKATRLLPSWILRADMRSSLDPNGYRLLLNTDGFRPLRPEIMTRPDWENNFLTPGADDPAGATPPTFVVFDPSVTPSATPSATASTTVTVTATSTTPVTPTVTATRTRRPPTAPPTATSITSTPEGSEVSPPPFTEIGTPDGDWGNPVNGTYFVLDLSATPIVVNGDFDLDYDFVYYERDTGLGVDMDSVILSISMDDVTYYVVFNWGDDIPDNNSNVGDDAADSGTENDNQSIPYAELHNNTGVAVDVDNAPSNPPVGTYPYLAIQAPLAPTADGNDGADANSVQVTEVPP